MSEQRRKGPAPSCLCGACKKCEKRAYDKARSSDPQIKAKKAAQTHAWREANRDRYDANQRRFRQEKREQWIASKNRWYRENKEDALAKAQALYRKDRAPGKERARRHYYANREQMIALSTAWNRAHPERSAWSKRRRELEKRGVARTPDNDLMLGVLRRDPCAYCGEPMEHIDHIVPFYLEGDGDRSNLTASCAACNLSKNRTPLLRWMAERPNATERAALRVAA